jgi:hypothetical protein
MLESQHHMIFYRKTVQSLMSVQNAGQERPQAAPCDCHSCTPRFYPMVCEALHRSFEQAQDLKPSTVVFLGPLHQEVLAEHEPAFLFTPQSEGITIASHVHHFDTILAAELTLDLPASDERGQLFHEEPALEWPSPSYKAIFRSSGACPSLRQLR